LAFNDFLCSQFSASSSWQRRSQRLDTAAWGGAPAHWGGAPPAVGKKGSAHTTTCACARASATSATSAKPLLDLLGLVSACASLPSWEGGGSPETDEHTCAKFTEVARYGEDGQV
jgi:hypothetical protein